MQVDASRLGVIGIDRIVINNFKILNFEELKKETKQTVNDEIIEKIEYIEYGIFSMSYTNKKNSSNSYYFSSLELNPNKLKNGHNIYNANTIELKESIEIVLKKLEGVGIKLDLTEAKIKEIEINTTLLIDFEELQEVILLIGRANYNKALVMSNFRKEDVSSFLKKDRTLYLNSKVSDLKKGNPGKVIKLYDKTFETYLHYGIAIKEKLTRIEVVFGQEYFRNVMERAGLDNSLKTFLSNNIISDIFNRSLKNELLTKPAKYLERLKKNLTYSFNNFRKNENIKRMYRKRYIELGKKIPEHYKEERGVLKYLKENCWIFDYSFLLEIVAKNIVSKQRKDFEKQIFKNYIQFNNLSLYKLLLAKCLGDFFLTDNPVLVCQSNNSEKLEL